ncbi:MAG TPA: sulfatase [Gemmataceae bacterium]
MRLNFPGAVLALATWAGVPPCAGAGDRPPNVVLILADDLGWTDLGCFGSDLHETPNLDRLAAQGTKFTAAYAACTVCSPTRAAILTGKYPARLHVTDWIHGHRRPFARLLPPKWTEHLPRDEVTIAEVLKTAGYATGHVGKWHLGDKQEGWPGAHGFDVNAGGTERGSPPSYFSPYKIPSLPDGPEGEYLTDREAAEAERFIEAHKDGPFFLYLPHHAVHTPIQAKKGLTARYRAKVKPGMRHQNPAYAAMVHSLDDAVGRVLDKLEAMKLADRTVVIFTSDNGGQRLRNITTNVPLRAGKGSAYEGGVRVPLIIRWPGVTRPGSVCAEPVISCDYYPTILEITGAKGEREHDRHVDGVSIVPLLKDPAARLERDALFWHYPHYHPGGATPYGAVRAGDWRLVEFYEDNRAELYNLKEDVGEENDLAARMPEKAAELRRRLHAWREAVGAQMPVPNPDAKK